MATRAIWRSPLPPAARAALVELASAWDEVAAQPGPDGTVLLLAEGLPFARVRPDSVELHLPPRVRDMLVQTGRARALGGAGHAVAVPDEAGQVDPDLLLLAWERARVRARVQRGPAG